MRRPLAPDDHAVAVHESAHCVACLVLKHTFDHVRLDGDESARAYMAYAPDAPAIPTLDRCVILLAPAQAEHLLLGRDSHVCVRPHLRGDHEAAIALATLELFAARVEAAGPLRARVPSEREADAWLAPCRHRARELVFLHRDWIHNTAMLLCLRRRLTPEEVAACRHPARPVVR